MASLLRTGLCLLGVGFSAGEATVSDSSAAATAEWAAKHLAGHATYGELSAATANARLSDPLDRFLEVVGDLGLKAKAKNAAKGMRPKAHADTLAMVHIPTNFGHTIERDALRSKSTDKLPGVGILPHPDALASFKVDSKEEQWWLVNQAKGYGGEVWGMMNPDMRGLSKIGCDMYYSPQKYWPQALAQKYLGNRTVFGILRDPYDRLANEFRMQATDVSSLYEGMSRHAISEREGSMERESDEYMQMYKTCDVNKWIKEEMLRFKAGDRFRGNCHLLPQNEFFDAPHGITMAIDNRRIPESFNAAMVEHGYNIRMAKSEDLTHNVVCDQVTAFKLDHESKKLIREAYADDFELICRLFGYCNANELTCMHQIPGMCGKNGQDAYKNLPLTNRGPHG